MGRQSLVGLTEVGVAIDEGGDSPGRGMWEPEDAPPGTKENMAWGGGEGLPLEGGWAGRVRRT